MNVLNKSVFKQKKKKKKQEKEKRESMVTASAVLLLYVVLYHCQWNIFGLQTADISPKKDLVKE